MLAGCANEGWVGEREAPAITDQLNLKKGDRAVLCSEPGPGFFSALWACFSLGVIAVPVCPPDPFAPQSDAAKKLQNIISDCKPAVILTSTTFYQVPL